MSIKRHPSVLLLTAALAAPPLLAQQAEEGGSRFNLGSIDMIEVEGRRSAAWDTPFQATINADELRRFERNNVSDALNLLPGVSIQNVGARSEKLVYVRGFNSRQVPLFIDGMPVYVPYDGNFDLSRILTFDIAEISVSKGFSSVLYGANTLGGSINVVSRRPQQGLHGRLSSSVDFDNDSHGSAQSHVLSLENGTERWYVQANAAWLDRDHFSLPGDFTPVIEENGGERENSANEDLKLSLKLGYTPNDSDEYAISYQRQESEKRTPPYAGSDSNLKPRFWRWPDYDKESLYFISRTALGQSEYLRTRVYYDTFYNLLSSYDDASYSSQERPYAFNSIYDDHSYGASVEVGSTRFEGHALRAALQYKRDVHREHDVGMPEERMEDALISLGLEDTWTLSPALSLVGGVGWDRQEGRRADDLDGEVLSSFPVATARGWNAQMALRYALSDSWDAHVSVARRTRFPTMKDRYSYRMGSAIPNPGLEPEYAVNLELGISGALTLVGNALRVSGAVFQSHIEDTIESVTIMPTLCTAAPCSQLQNIGRQDNQGLELAITYDLGPAWKLQANYTYLDRDNVSNPQLLPLDTPEHKLFAYAQYNPTDSLMFVLSAQHESGRYSATDGSRRTDSFNTVDFKAAWQALPQLKLELGGRNLGDEFYAFEEGFPEAGRSWFTAFTLNY